MSYALEEAKKTDRTLFGFWVYLMTDCVVFAVLFAAYAVLHTSTAGNPGAAEIFSLPNVLKETVLLLTSTFTMGLAIVAMKQKAKRATLLLLAATFLLGLGFLILELREFDELIRAGLGWQTSAFMSSFFTLVGTHGLHITIGLLWLIVMGIRVYTTGFNETTERRITMLSMFWHFLDVIWIFIFSIVYLMGALS